MPRGNPNLAAVRPKGRKKGQKNKFTTFKNAIEESFVLAGGAAYLHRVSKTDPSAYLSFAGRIIPKQTEVSGPNQGPIVIRSNIHD